MENFLTTFFLLISLNCFAQIYPYTNGFEGEPSNQPPTAWGGSMKVLLAHGINDSKAVCGRVSSAVTVDSGITPLIGPLTPASVLSFSYRIIDQANYPSTPTNLDNGDALEVLLSTDSLNYQTVLLIDMNNHNPSFGFAKKKIYLSQFSGNSAYFKFRCTYGTGTSFYVDVDTLQISNDPLAEIAETNNTKEFTVYPNPSSSSFYVRLIDASENEELKFFSLQGNLIFAEQVHKNNCINFSKVFNDGIYFVQYRNTVQKLVIQQ
jgi:hypothetical protein